MSQQDMITAIISAIQTDENVITLIRALITNNITNATALQLQNMCTVLGINTSGS